MMIIGHRGARGLAPENTLVSIERALEHHVDEIEIDARVTKDGVVVLHHNSLVMAGDQSFAISQYSFSELKRYKPDLTTLDDALSLIDTKCRVCIEVKPAEPIKPIVAVLTGHLSGGLYTAQDFLLGSKSKATLLALHDALPDIEMVVIDDWSSIRAHFRARAIGATRISMLEYWIWPGFIRAMTKRGYKLCSYPPEYPRKERFYAKFGRAGITNNPAKAKRWAKHGLYGVITDYPDRFEK